MLARGVVPEFQALRRRLQRITVAGFGLDGAFLQSPGDESIRRILEWRAKGNKIPY
jgi:hypothetical protein